MVVRIREGFPAHCGTDVALCRNILASYVIWLSATRTAKLLPHLWRRPQDIIYVPAFILFGYYFAIMKLYALVTLHEVGVLALARYFVIHTHSYHRLAGVLAPVSATRLKQWPQLPLMKS